MVKKKFAITWSRFDRTPACDRQTDRQTDRRTDRHLATASRGINKWTDFNANWRKRSPGLEHELGHEVKGQGHRRLKLDLEPGGGIILEWAENYTASGKKGPTVYFGRNIEKFRQLFIIFGTNHPDKSIRVTEKL